MGCIMGLNLVFGLLSIVILLGYGLVEIPLSFFRYSSNNRKLRHLRYKVAEITSKLTAKAKKSKTLIHVVKNVEVERDIQIYKAVILNDVIKVKKVYLYIDLKI
jgi:hypothetical protein